MTIISENRITWEIKRKKNVKRYMHMSSSSASDGFREATGIRRATTSQEEEQSAVWNQTLAWSRLGRKRSLASLIGGGPSDECQNPVIYKENGSNHSVIRFILFHIFFIEFSDKRVAFKRFAFLSYCEELT